MNTNSQLPLVLHVLPVDLARGAQVYARELRLALDGTGARHRTLTLFGSDGGTLQPDASLAVPSGRLRALGFDPRVVSRLRGALHTDSPAVVVLHGGEPLKYLVGTRLRRDQIAYYKIGAYDERLTGTRRALHRRLLQRVGTVAVVSDAAAREARDLGVAPDRIVVIPNGRDPAAYRPCSSSSANARVRLVFVGHLDAAKRPERFVDVVAGLRHEGLDVDASIAGAGPLMTAIEPWAARAGVRLLGEISDVAGLLARSDILIFTGGPPEGMPGVLIEAGMSGLPVVTTAVPGAADVVADGESGFVVGVDDEDGLLRATRALVGDANRRRAMGAAARERCVARYGIEASTRMWRAVIQKMIDDQCASST